MNLLPTTPNPLHHGSRWRQIVRTSVIAIACGLMWPAVSPGQTASPDARKARQERVKALAGHPWEIQALRVQGKVRLDGQLNESEWQQAVPVTDFYQGQRNEGLPVSERTEVRVLYDENNLYIGWKCFDTHPELLKARTMFRDESGGADDLFAMFIDSFHGHRGGIEFVTNANGLLEDLLQLGETDSTRNGDFHAIWNSKGRRTPEGSEVEVQIPFKSLRFPPLKPGEEVVMGIGLKRNIPRKNEESMWPFVSNDSTWYRPAEWGHIRGLRDIKPGRSIEIKPYALGSGSRDLVAGATIWRKDAGVDVKWGVTSGLTADLTANTDFAQEEVDTQQINFTRFSLFFPEKRQLFLEGQQMFQFGIRRQTDLVFTRRIGLSPAGGIIPLRAGARLTGREGRTNIGVMNMQTGAARGLPAQNFTVMRLKQDVFSRSNVGVLFTNVQGGGQFNRVVAADGNFFFRRVWSIQTFVAGQQDTARSADAYAGYGRVAYDTDRLGVAYSYLDIGKGFNPGVGYVQRPDSRQHGGDLRYTIRPQAALVRRFVMTGSMDRIANHEGFVETENRTGVFRTEFETGDALIFTYTNNLEAIETPFKLRSDVSIAPGAYRSNTFDASLDTFRRRHTRLNLGYTTGGFWGGTRNTLQIGTAFRFNANFGFSLNYEMNRVDLPIKRFATQLLSSKIQIVFRNNLGIFPLLQYNQDTKQLSSNVRFRWIPRPGSDFFIVYNELDTWASPFRAKNRSLAIKFNYLFAM